jgi:hypothetical protein
VQIHLYIVCSSLMIRLLCMQNSPCHESGVTAQAWVQSGLVCVGFWLDRWHCNRVFLCILQFSLSLSFPWYSIHTDSSINLCCIILEIDSIIIYHTKQSAKTNLHEGKLWYHFTFICCMYITSRMGYLME